MNWISVKDSLPEKDTPILCFYCDQYIEVMEYWYDDEQTDKPTFFRPPAPPVDNVTHWMPLPSPPKDQEET